MFVGNDMMNDPRVSRHAGTLGQMGHRVLVVCPKSDRTSLMEERGFYSIRRITIPYSKYYRITTRTRRNKIPYDSTEAPLTNTLKTSPIQRTIRLLVRLIVFPSCLTWALWRAGREYNAQMYMTNDLNTLLAGILCSATSRILVHDAHELWPDQWVGMGDYPSPAVAWFRIVERVLLKRPDAVITVNEFLSEVLERRYSIPRPQVILNVPPASPSSKRQQRVRRPACGKVALYQGVYAIHRGLENLIRACAFLRKDITLVLRGYGPSENELRQIAGPFKNCRFENPVRTEDAIPVAASTADIGIVPYIPVNMNNYLASPNKLFEYIQAGLPVVGSDLPFLRKIIVGNKIGYVFDPRRPCDIARAINMATRDDALQVLRKNLQKIQKQYSWTEEQGKLVEIIRGLAPVQARAVGRSSPRQH
jgi:glycosyltransferase involved in cell wall biosynthesis